MIKLNKKLNKIIVLTVLWFFISATGALALKPDDPDYFLQWYINKLGLPEAWDKTTGSSEVVVAVLDTGLDIDHPDIAGNVWVNTDEIAGDGIDNDHNGYIDDTNGYDFVAHDADPSPDFGGNYDYLATTHGTIISGIIGAVGNNLRGISGISWNTKIMPIRVLDNYGIADINPTIEGIEYAIKNGVNVINLSFQTDINHPVFQQVLEQAYQTGIVLVAAAGNGESGFGNDLDENNVFPACYRTLAGEKMVIGVGSVNKQDFVSTFSNYGQSCVDVMAPGEKIYSTQIYYPANSDFNAYYSGDWQGTSLAAPIVSGMAALIKSINRNFSPALIYRFIIENVDSIESFNAGYSGKIGFGRINIGRAVKAAFDYNNSHSISIPVNNNFNNLYSAIGAETKQLPEVFIKEGETKIIKKFLAYAKNFRGGVNVGVGDINGDGEDEIITGAGSGGGPHIRIFNQSGKVLNQWFAYSSKSRNGVNVAVGDINGDRKAEIITGTVGDSSVNIFDYNGRLILQFFPYGRTAKNGITVDVKEIDNWNRIIVETKNDLQKAFDNKGKFYRDLINNDRMLINQKYASIRLIR